jgi:hypothetical protein
MQPRPTPSLTPIEDEIESALAWHNGDARATIATLLDDCRHLRQQLVLASATMSKGMARGWVPKFDRR